MLSVCVIIVKLTSDESGKKLSEYLSKDKEKKNNQLGARETW